MALAGGETPDSGRAGLRVRRGASGVVRGVVALAGAIGILLVAPLTSLGAGGLGGVVGGLTGAVPKVTGAVGSVVGRVVQPPASGTSTGSTPSSSSSSSGSSGSPASSAAGSRAGSGSSTTPAMYGTNPHGQGTVAGVALTPSTNVPYPSDPNGSGGEVAVVGRGRSEQGVNGYHAHTTLLALLGKEILGVDALPGQSNTGPLDALQKGVLDKVCQSSGMLLCLTVLTADTIASSSGASTHFQLARATLAGSGHGVDVGVAESRSAINTTGSCQTSSGSSSAATVNVMGGPVATAGQSSESSSACAGQAASQQACSRVLGQAAANTLPFTGQDVLKVLFLGLLLVAGGLALAMRTRQMS